MAASSTCTGIILAGGASSRFQGNDKAFLQLSGRTFLERLYETLRPLFRQLIIVTNQPLKYTRFDALLATDLFTTRCAMTGIHAGLFYARTPYAFICACDTPLLKAALIEHLLGQIDPAFDMIVPQTALGPEPLLAIYARTGLAPLSRALTRQDFKISRFINRRRVKRIGLKTLAAIDPDLESFFNINTPEDLASITQRQKKNQEKNFS